MQAEFLTWLDSYRHAPLVREMKNKLLALSINSSCCEIADGTQYSEVATADEYTINKTISRLAVNLRTKSEKGCQFIDAYNHFFAHKQNG